MSVCIICRFETQLDDVVMPGGTRSCICLRCYTRETGTSHPMPKELRKDVIATLAAMEVH